MTENIRARVKAGMLELLEKVNLPEGTEVTLTIQENPMLRIGMPSAVRPVAGKTPWMLRPSLKIFMQAV